SSPCAGDRRDRHSFPTRRSSDLSALIDQLEAEGTLGDAQIRELRYLLLHRRMLLTSARDDVVTLEKQCRQLLDDYPEMTHPYMVDRKSTRLNSSHVKISYAVFCL